MPGNPPDRLQCGHVNLGLGTPLIVSLCFAQASGDLGRLRRLAASFALCSAERSGLGLPFRDSLIRVRVSMEAGALFALAARSFDLVSSECGPLTLPVFAALILALDSGV